MRNVEYQILILVCFVAAQSVEILGNGIKTESWLICGPQRNSELPNTRVSRDRYVYEGSAIWLIDAAMQERLKFPCYVREIFEEDR